MFYRFLEKIGTKNIFIYPMDNHKQILYYFNKVYPLLFRFNYRLFLCFGMNINK